MENETLQKIADVLDETIAEWEALQKGELTHTETTMYQGEAPNGDMIPNAKQGSGKPVVGQGNDQAIPATGGPEYDQPVAGPDSKGASPVGLGDYMAQGEMEKAVPPGLAEEKEAKPEDEKEEEGVKEAPEVEAKPEGAEEGEEKEEEGAPVEGKEEAPKEEGVEAAAKPEMGEEAEDGDEAEMEKFMGMLYKALTRMGMVQSDGVDSVYKSEDEDLDLMKSEEVLADELAKALDAGETFETEYDLEEEDDIDVDTLMKSAVATVWAEKEEETNEKLSKMEETLAAMQETLEKIGRQPASGKKSVSGWVPLRKSALEDETPQRPTLTKSQVLDKLVALQAKGDPRITRELIPKFEVSGDYSLVQHILD
jgi:hypothetical protein